LGEIPPNQTSTLWRILAIFSEFQLKEETRKVKVKVNKKAATLSNIHRDQYVDAVSF
jgi:hypothetical protein